MRRLKVALAATIAGATLFVMGEFRDAGVAKVEGSPPITEQGSLGSILSPMWSETIRQWSIEIDKEAKQYGLDPDFIAAVISAESNGDSKAISRVGAVGLMGVMPKGPGLEWRPSPETLIDPEINISWGVAILAEIIQQSGGDIIAALAAYSGGWDQANSRVPLEYASRVLDAYGRAVAVRSKIDPNIASRWTIATQINRGDIPIETLILTEEPLSGLRMYGEHLVYRYSDSSGKSYYIKGYAVPLDLVVPLESHSPVSGNQTVDKQLLARLGLSETKINNSNTRVLLACLPSLSRLRGELATRWYAPSGCPSWHR